MNVELSNFPDISRSQGSLIKMAFQLMTVSIGKPSDQENKIYESLFLDLIKKEESLISAICFSYSSSLAEYDDLRQDALINIWKGLPGFKGEASCRTWLYRVVLNSCVSTVRRHSRHKRSAVELTNLYDMVTDESIEDRESIEALHGLIATLGDEDKALILTWLDGVSYDEIAEIMGLKRNTVATRLHRIKEKLSRKADKYI